MSLTLRVAGGGARQAALLGVSTFCSPWSTSSSLHFTQNAIPAASPLTLLHSMGGKLATSGRNMVTCSTVQESSSATVAAAETKDEYTSQKEPPTKTKTPVKPASKPLPQMMEEDVIPSLRAILEAQEDISGIELVFIDNKLEGSFLKKGNPYSFWAFFPNGVLTGPKGFSLSSYNSGASTVEPFLIDEKKITGKHVVFWVEKRLAAQGLIPVWKD